MVSRELLYYGEKYNVPLWVTCIATDSTSFIFAYENKPFDDLDCEVFVANGGRSEYVDSMSLMNIDWRETLREYQPLRSNQNENY